MDAKEARQIMLESQNVQAKEQRLRIENQIGHAAKRGESFIIIESLFPINKEFLYKLGYKIDETYDVPSIFIGDYKQGFEQVKKYKISW